MASPKQSNALCKKRNLVDDCLAKDCKAPRIAVENGPSFGSSACRCHCCCMQPNLANDCVNYLKSGVPIRIVFYKQGSWRNFPEQIMKSLIEGFRGDKSSVVVVMDDQPLLVDFLSMTLVNLKSRKQRSVAWFDDTGKCFCPSIFFDEEADRSTKLDSSIVEGSVQGIMWDKGINSPPEVVKQVVIESSPPVPQNPSTADILRKKITSVERGSESFLSVQNLFLSGMGPFATPNNILHIHRYSPNDITAQCRLEAFERQVRSTREERGDANVRYGWLGSRKQDIVRILINGFGNTGKSAERAGLSTGIYLSPEDRAFTSVGLCDVDEKGVQYMLLCRAILGNMEAVKPGSQEYFPSSQIYDSGVDDCSNPKCYVMWPSHLSTHIRLEYLVSFKLAPKVREYLLGLKGLWFHPSPKEVTVDISTLQPVKCESGKGPTSPWISFRVLFAIIQDNISSVARELLFHHYEELKENKITREEMVKKMIIIVGEKLLADTLKKLHYSPSLWYKSPAEVKSNDPATTTSEPMCLDTPTNRNCASATLSTKFGDSLAPTVAPENSASLSTEGRDTLSPNMAPQSCLSLSTSVAPGNSTSVNTKGDSAAPSVAPKGRDSPASSMSPENSGSLSTKGRDTFAPSMAPIVCDSHVTTVSENSASLSAKGCSSFAPSMAPKGRDSLAPSLAAKGREFLAPSFAHKGRQSLSPSLVLWKPCNAKGLNSFAPSMAPKGREFLVPSMAPQRSACLTTKGRDALAPSMAPQNSAPSKTPGNSASPTAKGCDSPALSMAPKGRDSSPPSMPLKGRDSPAPNMPSKGPDSPASSMVPKDLDSPAPTVAAKGNNSPAPMNGMSKDPIAQCGAQNKFPRPGFHTNISVARAADTLVALSTLREKGG